jgi:hypothetical protein
LSIRGVAPHHVSPDTKRQYFKAFLNLDDDEGSPYSFSILKADMEDVNHIEGDIWEGDIMKELRDT